MKKYLIVFLSLAIFTSISMVTLFADTTVDKKSIDESDYAALHHYALDLAEQGNHAKAAEYLEKSLVLAKKEGEPPILIDNIKMKLAIAYVNSGNAKKGRALLREIHGYKTPK